MKKIAVLSDIHGNFTALEAVVADLKERKVTEIWLLGDIFMPGPAVLEIVDLLKSLPLTISIRGNWEDALFKRDWNINKEKDVYQARLAHYVLSKIDAETLAYIWNLPMNMERKIDDLTFLLTHNMPKKNYGDELRIASAQENFDALLNTSQAQIAIYGHIHHQVMRYSTDNRLILNPGSVGNPYFYLESFKNNLCAQYMTLEIENSEIRDIQFHKVEYDRMLEISFAQEKKVPYFELYKEKLTIGRTNELAAKKFALLNEKYGYVEEVKKYFNL